MKNRGVRIFLAAAGCALAASGQASETTIYQYDALGRLVAVNTSGTVNNGLATAIGYDPAGNRSTYSVAGSTAPPPTTGATSFAIGDATATEGDSLFFTLSRTGSTSAAASVSFSTGNGTAQHGSDYYGASNTVIFAAGESSRSLSIATIEDSVGEGTETLTMTLSTPSAGYALVGSGVATGTITDDDGGAPSFSIASAQATEGNSLFFTLSRSGSTAAAAIISYSTGDVTAQAGSDYVAASDTVTFAAGESSRSLSIATIQDSAPESTETLTMTLSHPSAGYTVNGSGVATGTIADDDAAVSSYSVADAQATEGNSLFFKVTRTGNTATAGTVNYQSADGPAPNGALSGTDYLGGGADVTFAAGQTERWLSFATLTDGATEGPETTTLTIYLPSGGGTIARAQAIGTINDP